MESTTNCGQKFYSSEEEAAFRFIARLTRDGFSGKVWVCILEQDEDNYFYAIKSSVERPQEIKTNTGCSAGWTELRSTSLIFHKSDAGTINAGFFK